jgi:AraC family transcriptional activator of pobA
MEETISIAKFKNKGLKSAYSLGDDLIVTDEIEHLEQFRYPCRLDAITILICTEGELHCRINLQDYCVRRHGILINFRENIIQIVSTSGFEAYAVLISSDYEKLLQMDFKQRLSSYINLKEKPLTYAPFSEIKRLKSYYDLLADNMASEREERRTIVRGLMTALTSEVISIINSQRNQEEETKKVQKTNVQNTFEHFMSLVTEHHIRERSVSFYAEEMNLTPNYLSGLMKTYSGKTASEWIDEYVIIEAKTLLKFSGFNIQQVAYKLNFPNQSTFGKYFKRLTGMSPKSYVET